MAVLKIDTNESEDIVVVTGKINDLVANRRAFRLLKDNSEFVVKEGCIEFKIGDDLNKCINRIQTAAKYAQCEVVLQGGANSVIQSYY